MTDEEKAKLKEAAELVMSTSAAISVPGWFWVDADELVAYAEDQAAFYAAMEKPDEA